MGEIAKKYLSLGGENSWLGKPVQNQVEQVGGFIQQRFEHGYIPWNGKVTPAYQVGNGNPNVTVPSSQPTTNFVSPLNWKAEFINRTPSNAADINFNLDRKDGQKKVFADIPSRVDVKDLGSQSAQWPVKAKLNVDFGSNSPTNTGKVQSDNFGMLVSTEVPLESGKTYKFTTKSDDGSAFNLKNLTTGQWIEPKDILVDPDFTDNTDWRDRGYNDPAKTVLFKVPQPGEYQLMFKLYDRTGAAQIEAKVEETFQDNVDTSKEWQLEVYKWDQGLNTQLPADIQTATTAGNGLEYMGRVSAGSNTRPDGTKGTRQDGAWWYWGEGSPNHNDPRFKDVKDQFVAKGVTEANFKANQTYKFTVSADDGYQLYARYQDGTKEAITPENQWIKDAYGSKTIDFTPKKDGAYKVVAYMFENTGDAFFDLSWKEVAPPSLPSNSSKQFTISEYYSRLYGDLNGSLTRGIQYKNGKLSHGGMDTVDSLQPYNVRALVGGKVISAKSGVQLNGVSDLYNEGTFDRGYDPVTGKLVIASNYNAEVVIWNEELKRKFTYLHFSEVKVAKDSYVNPGDIIGTEGSTGYSTGRHAHLGVRTDQGGLEDPLVTLGIARGQGILDKIYR